MYVRLAHHRRFWCLLSDERETELTFGRFWRILQVIWRAVPSLELAETACLLGYEDPNSFFRAFREWGHYSKRVESRAAWLVW